MENSEFCVFHDTDVKKKKDRFLKEFTYLVQFASDNNEKDRILLDGFIFPSISINMTIKKEIDFYKCIFKGEVYISRNEFTENFTMSNSIFEKDLIISENYFYKSSCFYSCTFKNKVSIRANEFKNTLELTKSKFYKNTITAVTLRQNISYEYVHFIETIFSTELRKISLKGATLEKVFVNGSGYKMPLNLSVKNYIIVVAFPILLIFDLIRSIVYRSKINLIVSVKTFSYYKPYNIYRGLNVVSISNNKRVERFLKDEAYLIDFMEEHPIWFYFWMLFSNCGRSFTLILFWSTVIILGFAFLFTSNIMIAPDWMPNNIIECWERFEPNVMFEQPEKYQGDFNFKAAVYYSIVTFTTLGFGDIVPLNEITRWIVAAEVIVGYIMLGMLISVLGNKIARRS